MADGEGKPWSELAVRTASALAMLAVSGLALWAGGMAWVAFVLVVGAGVWFEWSALCLRMHPPGAGRTAWRLGGAIYCGIACAVLLTLRDLPLGMFWVLAIVGAVIATDVGAYACGRLVGGPRIAPAISPSKTWAGLLGGMVAAGLTVGLLFARLADPAFHDIFAGSATLSHDTYRVVISPMGDPPGHALAGALVALVAQAGDFFESWMKRRAGVKDSSQLIPGHGGVLDRLDGLLAVLFVIGVVMAIGRLR